MLFFLLGRMVPASTVHSNIYIVSIQMHLMRMAEKRGELDPNIVNKLVLKKAVEHKIRMISDKAFISEREVYDLIRGFFKKYINIDYEFTADELIKELKKIYIPPQNQEQVVRIMKTVSEMEHVSRSFSKEELTRLLEDFRVLVESLIVSHYEKHGLFGKVRDAIGGSVKDHKNVLDDASLLNENERVLVKMNVLLDNSRRWSESDLDSAKSAYKELITLYSSLDDEKKAIFFKPLQELYALLTAKERLKELS
jgi:hypothetical protein